MALAFAEVVTAFVNWLTAQPPESLDNVFTNEPNSFGAFMNAVIAFVILGAVVYFLVVFRAATGGCDTRSTGYR